VKLFDFVFKLKKEVNKMPDDLITSFGISSQKDSYSAGEEAARKAIEKHNNKKRPDLVLVFASAKFNQEEVLDGVTSVSKSAVLAGGSSGGVIISTGITENSVCVVALSSKSMRFFCSIVKGISKNPEKAGNDVAKSVLESSVSARKNAKTLLLFTDGLSGKCSKVIDGAKQVLGESFEIVGGAFSDDAEFNRTYQYFNGKVFSDSAIGILICGDFVSSTGMRSGWESLGAKFKCTEAVENVVYKFGNKKAVDMFAEYLGKERAAKLPMIGHLYPVGLAADVENSNKYDTMQLIAPIGVDKQKGSVIFTEAIPVNTDVSLTYASRNTVIECAREAAIQAKRILNDAQPLLVFMFSSIARKMVLGRRVNEEIDAVKTIFGSDVPIVGFYTYGEIGPIDKRIPPLAVSKFHNQTAMIFVIGKIVKSVKGKSKNAKK